MGQPVSKKKYYVKNNTTEGHSERFPQAKVYPQRPRFLQVASIFNSRFKELQTEFEGELTKQWQTRYCHFGAAVIDLLAENILRCGAVEPANAQVNAWFKNQFGISYQQMMALVGRQ